MEGVNLGVAESRMLVLTGEKSFDEMKELAWNKKTTAFSGLKNILSRPKPEDIHITHSEKQYKPFWHVVFSTNLEYKRKQDYQIKIKDKSVRSVNIFGEDLEVDASGNLVVQGIEHCVEETSKELFVDATTEAEHDMLKYMEMPVRDIQETEELDGEDVIVVQPKIKAAYIVRKLLAEMLKPLDADEILDETVNITTLDLYFRPLYAFEYTWEPKNKHNVLEFDGLTGEFQSGKVLREKMAELFDEEVLFEIGSEVAGVIVPGGSIPVKILQESRKKKKG